MDVGGLAASLHQLARARASAEGADWLARNWPGAAEECRSVGFRAVFAAARRRLGEAAGGAGAAPLPAALAAVRAERRPAHLLGRLALLLRAAELLPGADLAELVRTLYQRGDSPERCAVLCSLSLLPQPAHHLETALLGTRQYVREVFEALAVDNPYPATHFPDPDFHHLVLKALFMGVPLGGVDGLAARGGDELRRMVADFVRERRAAGREVPVDVRFILPLEQP